MNKRIRKKHAFSISKYSSVSKKWCCVNLKRKRKIRSLNCVFKELHNTAIWSFCNKWITHISNERSLNSELNEYDLVDCKIDYDFSINDT